ncbi:MAG: sigma-70 family RNA polymerase sigma factor [Candidatus Hydrogenedentes bacterium]|nr:sigma-70 family RNA polymerase sigma factor [Candidatus Hydrogenedentota bacterium]
MPSNPYRTEEALIAACLSGDPEAWECFAVQYRRIIRSTAAQLRRGQHAASTDTDDLEGHIYQKLLEDDRRRLRAWKGRAKFSTYLVQVTRNLVLDYYALRNKGPLSEAYQAHTEGASMETSLEDEEIQRARQELFRAAVQGLPEKQAMIIQLRLAGKTLNEIAAITNRPLGTIGVENSRAMEKLRVAMMDRMQELKDGE